MNSGSSNKPGGSKNGTGVGVKRAYAVKTANPKTAVKPAKSSAKSSSLKATPAKAPKTPMAGKAAKRPSQAFARGDAPSRANQGPTYIPPRQTRFTIVETTNKKVAMRQARAAPKSGPAKSMAAREEKLIPFVGWTPVETRADMDRLIKARGNQFSEDFSFED